MAVWTEMMIGPGGPIWWLERYGNTWGNWLWEWAAKRAMFLRRSTGWSPRGVRYSGYTVPVRCAVSVVTVAG